MRLALPLLVAVVASSGAVAPAAAQGRTTPGTSPFLRSVPTATATGETPRITIREAISLALEHNLGLLMADHGAERARGARWMALSELLPSVSGRVTETRQVLNLAAFGFPLPAGAPSIVGPFNLFDARISFQQSILDFGALNDLRAERHNLAAAEYSYKSARDLVVLAAGDAYLRALAAGSRAESAQAQLRTADALLTQATDLKTAGIIAGIDVLRAQLQVTTQRQRATAANSDAEKVKLQLARVIGLPAGQAFSIVDDLPDVPRPTMTIEEALERAYKSRPDYQAALARVRAAEASRRATIGDSLPSVRVDANYGDLGRTLTSAHSTYAISGSVVVPIFQGGRRHGQLLEADAELKGRQAEADDLRAAIDYEIRTSFLDLQASEEQLQVATEARELAAQQLTQARDRLAAGVASNIEVVQAQEAVSLASEQYITARYGLNSANAALARDLGEAEAAARQFLGGIR